MARFCPLFSGSSGNACYVGTAKSGILVDVGVSCRTLLGALRTREIDPAGIQGIFITHEHSDHIKGLKVLLKQLHTTVYATGPTLGWMLENEILPNEIPLETVEDRTIQLDDLSITSFSTPHDAVGSTGYRIETSDGRKIGIATDLGHVTPAVQQGLDGCDLVLLEANYDTGMLRSSSYPYSLKRRIASNSGHLSNEGCAEEAARLMKNGTTRFVLGHLSKENNLPLLAHQAISTTLDEMGGHSGLDYLLSVAPREQPGQMMLL